MHAVYIALRVRSEIALQAYPLNFSMSLHFDKLNPPQANLLRRMYGYDFLRKS